MAKTQNVKGEKMTTVEGRLSFPSLFRKSEEGEMASNQYECTLLFDKKKADADKGKYKGLKSLKAAAKEVAKAAHGPKTTLKSIQHPFNDGDEKNADQYPEYQGQTHIVFRTFTKPKVVDLQLEPCSEEDVYPGCWVRVSCKPVSYTTGKKGVRFMLLNVQKVRDDEPFGDASSPEDDFEAEEGEEVDENEAYEEEDDDDI